MSSLFRAVARVLAIFAACAATWPVSAKANRPMGWHVDPLAYRLAAGGHSAPDPTQQYYPVGESRDDWRERITIITLPARDGERAIDVVPRALAETAADCTSPSRQVVLEETRDIVVALSCRLDAAHIGWGGEMRIVLADTHAYVMVAEAKGVHDLSKDAMNAMTDRWVAALLSFQPCDDWRVLGCVSKVDAMTLRDALPLSRVETLAVATAEKRAAAMYRHDQLAWHATDFAMEKPLFSREDGRGYVTTADPDGGGSVWFFVDRRGAKAVRLDLDASHRLVKTEWIKRLPKDIARRRVVLDRLRTLDTKLCSPAANVIVLEDALYWIAYVMSATTAPGVLPIGGHTRYEIDIDGKRVLATEPSANRCFAFDLVQARDTVIARDADATGEPAPSLEVAVPMASHVRSEVPTEFHAFASLTAPTPMIILTRDAAWRVEAGRIINIAQRTPARN